jgi:toxin ParE1/3/4
LKYRVQYEPNALDDLINLYDHIVEQGNPINALRYIERIGAKCDSLATFPLRGKSLESLRSGLRLVGFERKVTIAFAIVGDTVRIVRVLSHGKDISGLDLTGQTDVDPTR